MKIDKWKLSQIEMQEKIQKVANINVINCGNCGLVFFYDLSKKKIKCGYCGFKTKEPSDCPDYWCRGQEITEVRITPGELIRAKKILCGHEQEVKDMVIKIKMHEQQADMIDYIDDVVVMEELTYCFTAKMFLDVISDKSEKL